MPYDRQLIIKIKTAEDYSVITNGAAALASKANSRECPSYEVELDPNAKDSIGRLQMPSNWNEAVEFLKIPDTRNRIYILTHGNSTSPGTLQGLNAGEVAAFLRTFKGFVAQITLVVCRGGQTAYGGVNFAQQLAGFLVGFQAIVSAYTVPVAIVTQQLIEKYQDFKPQHLGKKFALHEGQNKWIRDYSSGVEKRLDVKKDFPTKG